MKNWIGQEIEVGSIVWRGARDGNLSSFKVGEVVGFVGDGGKVRVNWRFERGYCGQPPKYYASSAVPVDTHGTPDIHSLALIDPATLGVEIL